MEQMLEALERNQPRTTLRRSRTVREPERKVKAMDGVEKEERANPVVEILTTTTKRVQRRAFGEQVVEGKSGARDVERLIAQGRVRGGDDVSQALHVESAHGQIDTDEDAGGSVHGTEYG